MRNLRRIWQEERVLLWLRWKSCYEEQKERRMGKEKAETGRERKKEREKATARRSSLNLKCKYTQQITIGDRHPYF